MRRSERSSAGRLGGGEGGLHTPSLFQFRLVDRLHCQQSGTVKYTSQAADNLLSLQVCTRYCYLCCCFKPTGHAQSCPLAPLIGDMIAYDSIHQVAMLMFRSCLPCCVFFLSRPTCGRNFFLFFFCCSQAPCSLLFARILFLSACFDLFDMNDGLRHDLFSRLV